MTTPFATRFEFMPDDVMDNREVTDAYLRTHDYGSRIIVSWRGGDLWSVDLGAWRPQRVWDDNIKGWVYETSESDRTHTRFAKGRALTIGLNLSKLSVEERLKLESDS